MSTQRKTQHPHRHDSESDDDDLIVLANEDISKGIHACHKSLSGRIFADRPFSIGTIENALYAIWNKPKGFRVVENATNQFQLFFDLETDVIRIEQGAPWLFKNYILHVRRWNQFGEPKCNVISTFSVWSQFWGLHEQFKMLEVGRKLGGSIGAISEVDLFEIKGREARILKARVEINGEKRLRTA
ncbi:uncharacterized protein [Arachis hypogaea]|uniref:uncharacterized protein n=1 Tax=Arachis hypogaea TaxID=3818 RepID=UPI003B21A496